MDGTDLKDLHLAELHALASKLGVSRYRLLRREELIAEIESLRGGDASGAEALREAEPGLGPAPEVAEEAAPAEEEEGMRKVEAAARGRERLEREEATEEVTGFLELTRQRYGFLRIAGLAPHPDDVYISASQVRRCELLPGDEVTGPAREPKRGERHRALVHVDLVNGEEPLASERLDFDSLTAVVPRHRVALDPERSDVLTRAVDLLTPLALGQRVLVSSAPRGGTTTLLRGMARAISLAGDTELIVLLVDERPEEATRWREALPEAELAVATADMAPVDQVRVAELALARAKRRAESGADAVLVCDSLSRLAVAAGGAAEVKRLFGSGRELAEEGSGSLTVIASVIEGAEDDGIAERAVATTESSLITLDPELAAAGVHPALRPLECRVSDEEELRDPSELAAVRGLRSELADLGPREAASLLRERIEGSASNAELLSSLSGPVPPGVDG